MNNFQFDAPLYHLGVTTLVHHTNVPQSIRPNQCRLAPNTYRPPPRNKSNTILVSGSDDNTVKLWNPLLDKSELLATLRPPHRTNVFSAEFLGNEKIASSALDGLVVVSETHGACGHLFQCHLGHVVAQILPDPLSESVFFSIGDEGRLNRYDLREIDKCECARAPRKCIRNCVLDLSPDPIVHRRIPPICRDLFPLRSVGISSASFSPLHANRLLLGCSDSTLRDFDLRFPTQALWAWSPEFLDYGRGYGITCVRFDHTTPHHAVASFARDDIYRVHVGVNSVHSEVTDFKGMPFTSEDPIDAMIDADDAIVAVYRGHSNHRTTVLLLLCVFSPP